MKVFSNQFKVQVDLQVEDEVIKFYFNPLTYAQKSELSARITASSTAKEQADMVIDALKYSLISIEGLVDENDNPWIVKRENNQADDATVDMLTNIPELSKILVIAANLLRGIPKDGKLSDENGNEIEGLTICCPNDKRK